MALLVQRPGHCDLRIEQRACSDHDIDTMALTHGTVSPPRRAACIILLLYTVLLLPQVLLGYIKADKLSDGTKARLCERFQDVGLARRNAAASTASAPAPAASAAPSASCKGPAASSQSAGAAAAGPSSGTQAGMEADAGVADSEPSCSYTEEDVREWRSLADCLSMFEYSEKGLRNVVERLRYYKHALGDEHVYRVFKVRTHQGHASHTARKSWAVLCGVALGQGDVAPRLSP